MIGIVSYGAYIPKHRVNVAEIASFWERNPEPVTKSLGILQKSVSTLR